MAEVGPLSVEQGVGSVGQLQSGGGPARRLKTQAESRCWVWGVQKKSVPFIYQGFISCYY